MRSKTAAALFVAAFVLYNLNCRQISSDDTRAARYVSISILREGNIDLHEFFGTRTSYPYYLHLADDRLIDSYPPTGPLLALPVYAPFVWFGWFHDDYFLATLCSKLAAAAITASAIAFLYLAMIRLSPPGRTSRESPGPSEVAAWRHSVLFATCAVAFGTSLWSTSSQGLYSHAPAVLALSWTLCAIAYGRPAIAGAALGFGIWSRPVLVVAAPMLLLHDWWRAPQGRRFLARVFAGLLPVVSIAGAYNVILLGHLMGGAPERTQFWLTTLGKNSMFAGSIAEGLPGLLVSPSRGLFVYSPIVLLAVLGAAVSWRQRYAAGVLAGLVAAGVTVAYAKFLVWWGGHGYGPRYLTDIAPLLGVLIAIGHYSLTNRVPRAGRGGKLVGAGVWMLFAYSVAVQIIGAFCHPSSWTTSKTPPYWRRLWSVSNSQIVMCVREGPRLDPGQRWLLQTLGLLSDD